MRRQHRFNLKTDKREAERRFAKLRDLHDENLRVYCSGEQELWSPLALSYAEKIAEGEYRISYPPLPADGGFMDPLLEHAQMVHTMREWFPSLDLVPEDAALYEESNKLNEDLTSEKLRRLEGELKDLGVLPTGRALAEKLIAGSLHQVLDDYESEVNTQSLKPGSTDLAPYGRLRRERVKRFRKVHADIPLHDLNFDTRSAMIAYWRNRCGRRREGGSPAGFVMGHVLPHEFRLGIDRSSHPIADRAPTIPGPARPPASRSPGSTLIFARHGGRGL